MVDFLANLALETLRDLLVDETGFLLNVSGDVEKVKKELGTIHAMLIKADRERSDSPTLKAYVNQLKDLAFEAETVLETYAVEVEWKKKEGPKSLKEKLQRYICIMRECCSVHNVGKQARDILSRLADVANKLESEFGQQQSSSHSSNKDLLRYEYAHTVEPHFVGMEKDIKDVVSMVKDETRSRRVIKIYGMGGLGKTTLARKIYNHAELKSYDARAWVCITQQFQAHAVLGKILKQLDSNQQTDSMDVADLVEGIHSFLVQRRKLCLIVIDDIWENDHWDIIKPAFPMNCNVLLTTRSETIANRECHSYKLECLTEDEGWDLLQKIAFPQDFAPVETDLRSLEDIGRQIVLKCGRLPLAISVIGGILRQKEEHTLAEWQMVNMKMDSYLSHGGEGVAENTRVKEVLDLSYNVLPYYLKPCFLYLACFPEDEEIETERLYLLWMAEGFISHQDNETLRDVAERYLSELAMRCMVQVRKGEFCYSSHKKFDSCRLHDLMHDLCSSKVEKENLLKRIEMSRYPNGIPSLSGNSVRRLAIPSSIGNSISRLAIINDADSDTLRLDGLEKLKGLRSFMLMKFEYGIRKIQLEDSMINFERSESLRILVLDCCNFEEDKLPSKVSKLIHLRYLSLRSSRVRELPQFVCGMPYLQTLDLRVWSAIRLPNEIWKMKRLKHMYLPYYIEVLGGEKLRLDGLEALETLQEIHSETACIEDISKLISLKELHVSIGDMNSLSALGHHMSNNRRCRLCEIHLFVYSCDLGSEIGRDVFKNVLMSPSLVILDVWYCDVGGGFPYYEQGMCQNLVRLRVKNCEVGGDVMEELGNYPMLQDLDLGPGRVEFGKTGALTCRSNSFPQLKILTVSGCSYLHEWQVEERALPKLTELCIHRCSYLKKVPDGLRFISTLRQLNIEGMPKEFNERVRRQDYATVSHIPSLNIYQ